MANVLITGGLGFIGSHLAASFIEDGYDVTIIDDGRNYSPFQIPFNSSLKCTVISESLESGRWIPKVKGVQFDMILHLASPVGVELVKQLPASGFQSAIEATFCLMEFIRNEQETPLFFQASSSEVYGSGNEKKTFSEEQPIMLAPAHFGRWNYAYYKAFIESYVLELHREGALRAVIGRYFNVTGPRQSVLNGMVLPKWIHASLNGSPIKIYGKGEDLRSFCHIKDAVRKTRALLNVSESEGEIVNIGALNPITLIELAHKVVQYAPQSVEIEFTAKAQQLNSREVISFRIPNLDKINSFIGIQDDASIEVIIQDMFKEALLEK